MPDLKSCPFCGLAAQRGAGATRGLTRCIDSHCPGHSWATIDRWNTRAPAPPSDCPGPDCPMCNGEACTLCGAGCWNNTAARCEHDVLDRHRKPPAPPSEGIRAVVRRMVELGSTGEPVVEALTDADREACGVEK